MAHSDVVVATVRIKTPEGMPEIINESLAPEVERPTSERSKVNVSIDDGMVTISIEASDVAALRAAINSYLRWVGAILDVVETVG
jgi:tRNA threonylcarbamoyladenosine modification (KEOPS) complex  Pcc1 subunit